jgi:hypothetical protein
LDARLIDQNRSVARSVGRLKEKTMSKHATMISSLAFAILGVSNAAVASDTVTAPESGTFQGEVYVQSVSGSGCLDKAGFVYIGSMSYAGLSGATDILRALETGNNFAVNSVQTLAVKSGKGTTHPSGDLTWTGAGIGGSWSVTGTFTATVTEIGTHSFVLQLKETYSGCSEEDLNIPLSRIGVNQ